MNKSIFRNSDGRKQKTMTLQQKIDTAQKRKAKARAEAVLEPVTVSPVADMNPAYTAIGLVLRAIVLFIGIFGLNLFFCDAAKIVILNGAAADNITVSVSFLLVWSIVMTLLSMLLSLHKILRAVSPVIVLGAGAAYMFTTFADPVGFVMESARRFVDLIFQNMASAGYTTYMQYISTEGYSYDQTLLVKFAIAALIIIVGIVLGMSMAKRVHAVPVAIVCLIYLVPVFMFNITRTNKGLALSLIFICGAVALYLFDCIYGGIFAAAKAKRDAKKAKKLAKKNAKKAAKAAKRALKNSAAMAYNTAVEAGMSKANAKKARAAVFAKDKAEKEAAKKAEKARIAAEKEAKAEAKKAAKEAKKAAKLAKAEEKKKNRARAAAVKKSKNKDDAAAYAAEKKTSRANAAVIRREKLKEKNAPEVKSIKTRAASGFAGGMAMLIAFLAIWIPLAAVKKNFPIIDVINNKMQLVRTYVTAYLMGDDVDLNSLAMYGGVAELNPRTVNFETPQYRGQKLFSAEAGYAAPVYLRSWIGSNYSLETDFWSSADADEVIEYRDRFGSAYTPDNITYFFNKYVYPNALEVNKVDQYRNLDNFGFRVFQVHITRSSGTSRILFVPSIMNAGLGIMERGSIESTSRKYSAYYDGIYSSRFFDEGATYSVSSFNPVMKDPNLGVNLEGSIRYYNLAKDYALTIDTITAEQSGNILFKEDKEYTYDTELGELKFAGSDLSFLIDMFEEDIAQFGYKYKAQNFVEMYLNMTSAERKTFHNSYDKELNYRDYTETTYRTTFGSEKIAALADQILDEAGIVKLEKYEHDKSKFENLSENQLKRKSAYELYGNSWGSWFTDKAGNVVPRHEAVMAVINYLRNNYTYTLDPDCPQTELLDEEGNVVLDEEGNPVMTDLIEADSNLEAFLFDIKQGYCIHFATSAVALLREMGFAVRYDEGYIVNGWNRTYDPEAVSTYRTSVRDYDAHSWIEVYYPAMGWVLYECTPGFCEEMYDSNTGDSSSSSSSGGLDRSKITVQDPVIEEEEIEVSLGIGEDVDYTALYIALGVVGGAILLIVIVWTVLKIRAGRAMDKRRKLAADAKNELKYQSGEVDIHTYTREITDAIFDIFEGLGCPPETGELPTEYALRINEDYTDISKYRITEIMEIIEKEEFGGHVNFKELTRMSEYLTEITSSIYSALPFLEKFRMRYLLNVI